MSAHDAATQGEHAHTSAGKYVQIAVILFALTALEVLLYEVSYGGLSKEMAGLSSGLEPWFVEILLGLSALKFWFVAMFYMHLKQDIKPLSWVFAFSLVIACVVITAMIILFSYTRGLFWAGAPW
jgi:hypothetical protein